MPNRIIKESICTSENIDALSAFHETAFYRLMVNCDDYGRFDARPAVLASKLFPLRRSVTEKQISDALRALAEADLVILYEVNGKPYLQMTTWEKHQQVRSRKSKYPSPDEGTRKQLISNDIRCDQMISNDSKCSRNPIQSESNPNPNRESDKSAKRFTPPTVDEISAYCRERGNRVDAQRFCDFYTAKGWKVGKNPMVDWRAAVRNWEREDGARAKPRKPMDERNLTEQEYETDFYADIMNRPRANG